MQSAIPNQRPSQSQRRQQNLSDPVQPPNQIMNVTAGPTAQPRASSGSSRSQRSANPDKQISQIEKSVTHLLVATKQLLETLTQWSRGTAQEEEVSDVYVRLGYEFNLACRAFNSIGVDTSDLGNVPDLLRHILEDTLSQPASPQALDNYLPRIRDIIINLLHGLKKKQGKLRARGKEGAPSGRTGDPTRQGSVASTGSHETGLTQMLEDVPSATSSIRAASRQDSVRSPDNEMYAAVNAPITGSLSRGSVNRHSLRKEVERPTIQTDSTTLPNNRPQPMLGPSQSEPIVKSVIPENTFLHPPPPPPKQHDALTALQRGGDLERRASRRFSAYQISKHLGASPNGVPVIPATQTSPIPNRGREVQESLNAVRSRTSYQRTRSGNRADGSPGRGPSMRAPQRISEEREEAPTLNLQEVPKIQVPTEQPLDDSPIVQTPEEYHGRVHNQVTSPGAPVVGATISGPLSPGPIEVHDPGQIPKAPSPLQQQQLQAESSPATVIESTSVTAPTPSQVVDLETLPSQGKELILFLQYKSKIKKFVLSEGYDELTIARLQLAFIEKFAWNTHNHGVDLPEIYIQDPVSGVRHELEDLSDVKDRSVLVLNVEALDEVKKHFDDGLGGIRKTLESFKSLLDGQGSMMQRFSDRQLETSKEMARMSALPSPRPSRAPTMKPGSSSSPSPNAMSMQEVQNLRRDIAILRQTYSSMAADFAGSLDDIKAKAANVKAVASDAVIPSYKQGGGRDHINQGKRTLSHDSEALVNRVDDLSDVVEELRKDVVTRGVRPLPRQLENISKEISVAAKELTKVKEFMKREKPIWTKIWEQELQMVMSEREDLTQQDELLTDLDGDLEDITGVFQLVEEATKQQNLQSNTPNPGRSASKNLGFDSGVDPREAKEGVLDEVRALQPNHENRLEAIERAEKLRQKELESRPGGEFQREIEKFVEEGKLKKTGGADEVERLRKIKDEKARKEIFEYQAVHKAEMERRKAEKAAARAASQSKRSQEGIRDGNHTQSVDGLQDANGDVPPPLPAKNGSDLLDQQTHPNGPPQLPDIGLENASNRAGVETMADDNGRTYYKQITRSPSTTPGPDGRNETVAGQRDSGKWWQPADFTSP